MTRNFSNVSVQVPHYSTHESTEIFIISYKSYIKSTEFDGSLQMLYSNAMRKLSTIQQERLSNSKPL